ncbi:MAG: hypothetical protein KAW14_01835 [Candidatus Aegiribacteria sp.]|nr:hypothetical protein [Candidatus Aegiribacteria sp.]
MTRIAFSLAGIKTLPISKPALYRILTQTGNYNYVGVAKRGRIQQRLREHYGRIPGTHVKVEFFSSIKDARMKEIRIINKYKPYYNTQHT